jgi:pyruvate dehydrogenase E1 component beta subunit
VTTTQIRPAGAPAPASGVQRLTFARAITEGLRRALSDDPTVLLMGEDVGRLGGVFRVTDGLAAQFGEDRVVDTPLAESGIVGTAIGLALRGYRPVVEIQFDGFVFPAFDQITTQLAKLHYRSRGRLTVPVVIRIPYAGGIGAVEHHSESPEVLFAHTAGLRVVSPSSPAEAYRMIRAAIASPDPVIFLEPKVRYWDKGEVDLGADDEPTVPDGAATAVRDPGALVASSAPVAGAAPVAPGAGAASSSSVDLSILDTARVVRTGTDLTLVAYGPTVATALAAAESAATSGTSVEVVDLRALSPLDTPTVAASVRRTGRCVVVHEAPVLYGAGAEVAARVSEECFFHLEAPVLRVGGFHTPYPPAKLEHDYLPSLDRVLDAVDRSLGY